jgi:hypothetical protein
MDIQTFDDVFDALADTPAKRRIRPSGGSGQAANIKARARTQSSLSSASFL